MNQSILKRYPTLTEDDFTLRDDGEGIFIDVWKSKDPKPSMAQVFEWVKEDESAPKPKSEAEVLNAQMEDLKKELSVTQDALNFILMGGM